MKLILLFDRLNNKIKRSYRKRIFKAMIGCNHNDFSIVGDITVINKNIKLGHNVTIYPDVMLFGDGEIVIGGQRRYWKRNDYLFFERRWCNNRQRYYDCRSVLYY